MEQFKRYYNQNRKTIWGVVIIITFAFMLLRLANFYAAKKNKELIQNAIKQGQASVSNNEINNNLSNSTNSNTTKKSSTEEDVINQFINYCNERDIENAYNMLTDNCKEQMFRDVETFERIYYNSAFENKVKESTIEKWNSKTYLVKLKESALATGKSNDENQKGDYITVVKSDDSYKLNVNSYVGYKELNKEKEEEELKVEVVGKNTYMDYEEYTIKFTNNSKTDILLDSLNNSQNLYIEDSKGVDYSFYSHEFSKELLTIPNGHTRELKIKFYSSYVSNRTIKRMVFSDVWKDNRKINFKIEL